MFLIYGLIISEFTLILKVIRITNNLGLVLLNVNYCYIKRGPDRKNK